MLNQKGIAFHLERAAKYGKGAKGDIEFLVRELVDIQSQLMLHQKTMGKMAAAAKQFFEAFGAAGPLPDEYDQVQFYAEEITRQLTTPPPASSGPESPA